MRLAFHEYIDRCFAADVPLIVWYMAACDPGHRDSIEGIAIVVQRLATAEESGRTMAALLTAGFGLAPEYVFAHLIRLDTLLGQLEREQPTEQPRELEQPAAVPTLQEMAEHQAAYDAAIATDPTRWPVSQEEAAAMFARITERLKELDPLARELARTDPDGEWMTSDYIWRRMMAQGDE